MALEDIAKGTLLIELLRQWISNHAEHCGVFLIEDHLPHDGDCQWELPEVIRRLPPSELYLAYLNATGQEVGIRLESWPEVK